MELRKNQLSQAALAVLALCLTTALAAQPTKPAAYAPADSEIILGINLQQVIQSGLFQKMNTGENKEKLDAGVQMLRGLTGIDLLQDVDGVYAFGRIDDEDSFAIAVQGRFEREMISKLIVEQGDYAESVLPTGHTAYVSSKAKDPCLTFATENLVIAAQSPTRLETVLRTAENLESSFAGSEHANLIGQVPAEAAVWAIMTCPAGAASEACSLATTYGLKSLLLVVNMAGDQVNVTANIRLDSDQSRTQVADIISGARAMAALQKENAEIQRLANMVIVNTSQDQPTVEVSIAVPNEEIMKHLPQNLNVDVQVSSESDSEVN